MSLDDYLVEPTEDGWTVSNFRTGEMVDCATFDEAWRELRRMMT